MPEPSVQGGHYDELLTNISVAYLQSAKNFVAGTVFPEVPVQRQSGVYWEFPRGFFFRDEVGPRPVGGYSNIAGYDLTTGKYFTEEQALTAILEDRERANATPPYDPERTKVEYLTQQHLIHKDRDWASAYMKTGVWGTDLTGVASGPTAGQFLQWDNANSTPIEDVDAQKETVAQSTGFEPNVLVLGRTVYRILRNHPNLIDRVKYTQRGVITLELMASLFDVDKVVVPGGVQNTAAEGEADNFQFIVNNKAALLAYAAPSPGLQIPSAGYTFSWRGLLGAEAGKAAAIWRGRDNRGHFDWFEGRMAYEHNLVGSDLAVFFASAVA